MKILIASVSLLSLLFFQSWISTSQPLRTSIGLGSQQITETRTERRRKNFEKAKNLLVSKKVPFDPEILLTPDWPRTLRSTFNEMPELKQVRRGTNRLKGRRDGPYALSP